MLTALLLATAIAAGVHPAAVGVAALAVVEPRLVMVIAAGWGLRSYRTRRRGHSSDTEAAFLRALAAELRAGASLRLGLAEASLGAPLGLERASRLARSGMPMDRIAPLLQQRLAFNGVTTAAALELSSSSGARAAAVFDGLADRATEAADLYREQRAATTQARLSAWVVGLAPLGFTGLILAGGGLESISAAGGVGVLVIAAGVTLEIAGLAVVALILHKEGR
jgi:tight adherence protein B